MGVDLSLLGYAEGDVVLGLHFADDGVSGGSGNWDPVAIVGLPALSVPVIPEPATAGLVVMALAGGLMRRRRVCC